MSRRVELAFRRAADDLLPSGTHTVVAVSGGADSVALLHLLARRSRSVDTSLTVAHLDHGLRADSDEDRRFVEALADSLDLPCRSVRREVPAMRRADESPEEAARRVRREFLREARREVDADVVATAHTLDDQAETILMRWIRGAGPTALAGMRVRGPGRFVRPLLAIPRADVVAFLEAHGFPWREDPSNADERFDRNRLRRRILPLVRQTLNPRAAERIVAAAAHAREDAELLDALAGERFDACARFEDDALRLPLDVLEALPLPLRRRVLHRALATVGTDPRRVTARHVEALDRLRDAQGGRRVELPGGRSAERRGRDLILRPAGAPEERS